MASKLSDRIELYEESSNYKLLPKLPLIFKINGKGFNNTTSLLDKPFDKNLYDCLSSTMKLLCSEIEGAQIGYLYNDTIIIVARNDQNTGTNAWYNNNLSKLISVTASLSTAHFFKCANHISLSLSGLPTFTSNVFPVPNISEAVNALIYYQQFNSLVAIQFACYYELLKKYDKSHIKKTMYGLSQIERLELLEDECSINFDDYPSMFRKGSICIKNYSLKYKWEIIENISLFSNNQEFLKENMSA